MPTRPGRGRREKAILGSSPRRKPGKATINLSYANTRTPRRPAPGLRAEFLRLEPLARARDDGFKRTDEAASGAALRGVCGPRDGGAAMDANQFRAAFGI